MKPEASYHKSVFTIYFIPFLALTIIGCIMLLVGSLDSNLLSFALGTIFIIIGSILVTIYVILLFCQAPHLEATTPLEVKGPKILYADDLVRLTDSGITFLRYSFIGKSVRMVPYSSIESVQALKPTLKNGKWRIEGARGNGVWFLWDGHRPSRDRIFVATLRNERTKLGFTVVDSSQVEAILKEKSLIWHPDLPS